MDGVGERQWGVEVLGLVEGGWVTVDKYVWWDTLHVDDGS